MAGDIYGHIYSIVRMIPRGKVSTYGDIAMLAGNPALSRVVGNALHCNPYEGDVPCHRVVNSSGRLALNFGFGGLEGQKKRLDAEGVEVSGDCVDLDNYRWKARLAISSCLLGENCKYNGGNNLNKGLIRLAGGHEVLSFCPEMLGGLPCPRVPCEIVGDRILSDDGGDFTDAFRFGAQKALKMIRDFRPDFVILQSRSPSCGVGEIYDGTFSGRLVRGHGVFAALAIENGYKVIDAGVFSGLRQRARS